MHLALSSSALPYIQSLLGSTGVLTGHLGVLLQHGGPHHVHITVQVIQEACEDVRSCVEIDQKVSPSAVPLVVFGYLIGQQSLSEVLQVSHHCAPLHQGLHRPPESSRCLRPLHRLQDQGQFVTRHRFGEEIREIHTFNSACTRLVSLPVYSVQRRPCYDTRNRKGLCL